MSSARRRAIGPTPRTTEAAIAKARCAAGFRRPARDLAEGLANGNSALLVVPGCLPVPGGVPLKIGGIVTGAVGISGAAPDADDRVRRLAPARWGEGEAVSPLDLLRRILEQAARAGPSLLATHRCSSRAGSSASVRIS